MTPGSDLMLIKLAKAAFEAASWPTQIAAGRYMYPLDNNLCNVRSVSGNNVHGPSKKSRLEGKEQNSGVGGSFFEVRNFTQSQLGITPADMLGGMHPMP